MTFNIEVFNQGNVTAQNIVVSDYIPSGYTFAANNGWTGGPSVITQTIAGPLAPGTSTGPLPLVLTLVMDVTGDDAWDNYAEVSAAQDTQGNNRNDDADSVADNNPANDNPVQPGDPNDNNILGGGSNASEDEDDHDPAAPRIVDLALIKEIVTPGPYSYGQNVTFRITVQNQGNETAATIVVSDYVPAGYTFAPNNGWGGSAPLITNTIPDHWLPAHLPVDLVLTVQPSAAANAWLNVAEISLFNDTAGNAIGMFDIDSDPDQNPTNDGEVWQTALQTII
ncbi:MAG: DUF11 domain-containing protein [Saprospiraceae bacterium]|nr:DUF11 domain-containing protein [Saprospiraceae bacterium]